MNKRPYLVWFDGTADIPVQQQVDDPANLRFVPNAAASVRAITGSDGNTYFVADQTVNPRGAKSVIWSSEGYVSNGVQVNALTAAQKGATHDHTINAGAGALDFSPYHSLTLAVNFTSFTGGASPTIQFELDTQDDSGTPVVLPLWKPAAITAAASDLVAVGPGMVFPQAATAPNAAATGFAVITAPAGWTYYSIPLSFLPNGAFKWTVTGGPTGATWTAWLYGSF